MYYSGIERPLTTFNVVDSVLLRFTVVNDSTVLFKKVPEYALANLSYTLGNRAAKYFIPTWKTSERMLFVNFSSRMQEATGYATDGQWAKAELIWLAEWEKKTKPADKVKIAFNLAVANEMQDKFEPAMSWLQKAKENLKSVNANDKSQETELIDNFMKELEQRIQNNQILDLQWGKE
jgi:hypothetical protein